MKLYEFVLAEDNKRDLTDPEAGRDWAYFRVWGEFVFDDAGRDHPDPRYLRGGTIKTLRAMQKRDADFELNPRTWKEVAQSLRPASEGDGGESERENWFDAWARNVRALRSLARRLDDAKTRPPGIKAGEADDILRAYLALPVKVVLDVKFPAGEGSPPGGGKKSKSVGRWSLPDPPLSREQVVGLKIRAGKLGGVHNYWQDVFLSLIDDRHAYAEKCQQCGCPLERTAKTHKPSRRLLCKKCQMKVWYAKLDSEKRDERRKKNRKAQAERRKKARAAVTQLPISKK